MRCDPSRHSLRGNLWSAWFNGSSSSLNVQGDTLAVLKVARFILKQSLAGKDGQLTS